ncbi:transcriptional regulator, LysR family [Xanthomonas citri pv. punicae str. LMG 859]|nr:transcriptional regulator, LysR family [Xanthomonas citri pv. punicae str. LMG 859]
MARLVPRSPGPRHHRAADAYLQRQHRRDARRRVWPGRGAGAQAHRPAHLQRYELVRLPGPTLKARYAYYIVHPSHRELSPAAALFIDWLKREAQDERTPMPALPAELVALPPGEGVQEPRTRRRLRQAPATE